MAKITYTVTGGSPPTISPTNDQIQLRQGDFLEFTRAPAVVQPIHVRLAGAGGVGPHLLCVVPTPPQVVTASVVVAGPNIVISFTAAALPSPRPPFVFTRRSFLVSATGSVTPSIVGINFVTGDVLNFKGDGSMVGGTISAELTAGGPDLFFEISPLPDRRVMILGPTLTGSSIAIALIDDVSGPPSTGPLP